MDIETEFLAVGIARARQITEKRGYPNDIRDNGYAKTNMNQEPGIKSQDKSLTTDRRYK